MTFRHFHKEKNNGVSTHFAAMHGASFLVKHKKLSCKGVLKIKNEALKIKDRYLGF